MGANTWIESSVDYSPILPAPTKAPGVRTFDLVTFEDPGVPEFYLWRKKTMTIHPNSEKIMNDRKWS